MFYVALDYARVPQRHDGHDGARPWAGRAELVTVRVARILPEPANSRSAAGYQRPTQSPLPGLDGYVLAG